MTHRQLKTGYFTLTALNTIASSYYFNYLFFFMRDRFGFGNKENLCITALHGLVYFIAAVQCGKFAQRRGNLLSLKIGFAFLALSMVIGAVLESVVGLFVLVGGYTVALLFTWPALESLVSEGESRSGVQRMVGIYNCTWAASAAFAFFTGGKLYDALGRGAIFWIPALLFAAQFTLTLWLERQIPNVKRTQSASADVPCQTDQDAVPVLIRAGVDPKIFLKMAWFASPFAYIAINTLLAIMPGIASQLGL